MQWLPWLQMARTEMRHSKWFEYLSECEMSASSWIIFTRERCRRSMCSKNLLCFEARVRTLYAQWDKQCWCWNGYSVFYIFYEGARFKGWKRVPGKRLPCVRSWRVLTSSRTRSCRTCCRMCCLWASCMIPILSSFLSVNLIRARPKQK